MLACVGCLVVHIHVVVVGSVCVFMYDGQCVCVSVFVCGCRCGLLRMSSVIVCVVGCVMLRVCVVGCGIVRVGC